VLKSGRSQEGTEGWKTSTDLSKHPYPSLLPDLGGSTFLSITNTNSSPVTCRNTCNTA